MPKLNVIRSPELTPFWRRPPERYAGELPDHTDVLVIGGGITGVRLLHHLGARRMGALLVERAHLAAGASGRESGFLPRGGAGRSGGAGATVRPASGAECHVGCVILATKASTPQLVEQVEIQPRRAQMLASAPDAAGLCDLPTYSHFGYRYWRQLATGEVLVGGWRDTDYEAEVGYDERPTDAIQAHLDAQLKRMGAEGKVTHRWGGTMGFPESGLPLVGPVEGLPNVYLCAGFNGHGMGFAFISAKTLVASL